MSSPLQKASELGNLLAQLPLSQDEQWDRIELTAQSLANDLRVKNVEQQTALGQTLLPQTLSSLLKGATAGTVTPHPRHKPAIFEILRVGANLCWDHDENRASLLEAGFPQTVVSLLEGYADTVKLDETEPMDLSIPDLQIVKTSVGVCLNTSVDYEPVKTRLISLEAAMTVLKLSIAIYPPGSWLRETHVPVKADDETAKVVDSWNLRSTLSKWVWSSISEWEEEDDNDRPRQLFTADILPHLSRILQAFVPPYLAPPPLFAMPQSRQALVDFDFDGLENATGQLERLALDVEEAKIALGRGYVTPETGGDSVLSRMLTFIENGDYPPYWSTTPALRKPSSEGQQAADEPDARRKGFDRCKAAIIKAVVEVAGDDKNTNVLWDETKDKSATPGGDFVAMMVRWIRAHKDLQNSKRDDLLVCALVNLGNLCRKDSHSIALVNGYAVVADLVDLLQPSTDLKIMHGLLGLLKHLATSPAIRTPLGQSGILSKLASSDIIHPRTDAVELLQMSAIGLVKHLCNNNVDNSFVVCLPDPSASGSKTLLDHILDLGRRSDSTAIKSESTRVVVNIIKSLWTTDISSQEDPSNFQQKRDEARKALGTMNCASALAHLIGRSRKYPMLVNEGVVALTLLSTGHNGGHLALDALMNPLPVDLGPHRQPSLPMSAGGILAEPMSVNGSPATATPRCALDMLVSFLHIVPFNFQPNTRTPPTSLPTEVRANICALLGHLGRKGVVNNRARDVEVLKENTRHLLETLAKDSGLEGNNNRSETAARKALDAWGKE